MLSSNKNPNQLEMSIKKTNTEGSLSVIKDFFYAQKKDELSSYRLFHGRGGAHGSVYDFNIDVHQNFITLYLFSAKTKDWISEVSNLIQHFLIETKCIFLQHRYLKGAPVECIYGEIPKETFATENNLKFILSPEKSQNPGFFIDMRLGRQKVKELSLNRNVLNLFAYTCSFSVSALQGGAHSVTNIDMKNSFLDIGKQNHTLNNLPLRDASFLKLNILKSFAKLKRMGPWDVVIIDPPSFQKGSFCAEKDYAKIIKKLDTFTTDEADIFACLNAPHLTPSFLIDLFSEFQKTFELIEVLYSPKDFPEKNKEVGLKILHYRKKAHE